MARVLIVDNGERTAEAEAALTDAGYAVRSVTPSLAGDIVDALENVTVVAYLLGDDPGADGEQLETVLLKVVDTGVRGYVFEGGSNQHVDHARETWHISIEEIGELTGEGWTTDLVNAVNRSLGL